MARYSLHVDPLPRLEEREDGVDVTLFDRAVTLPDIAESAAHLLLVDPTLGTGSLPGWDIVESIRSHPDMRDVPIIICSEAVDRVEERQKEIDRDPRTYVLLKPFKRRRSCGCPRHDVATLQLRCRPACLL